VGVKGFDQLKTKHLECRNLNHAWSHKQTQLLTYMSAPAKAGAALVELTFSCVRCKATRVDVRVRRTGSLESRTYQYPDYYQIEDVKSWGGRARFNANVTVELIDRYLKKGG
jgi:hypothetical protein